MVYSDTLIFKHERGLVMSDSDANDWSVNRDKECLSRSEKRKRDEC